MTKNKSCLYLEKIKPKIRLIRHSSSHTNGALPLTSPSFLGISLKKENIFAALTTSYILPCLTSTFRKKYITDLNTPLNV